MNLTTKALRPDDLLAGFYQKFLRISKTGHGELVSYVNKINITNIVLIPKVNNPENMK